MELEIENEMICGTLSCEEGGIRLEGDFRVRPSGGKADTLNLQATKGGQPAGSVDAWADGGTLRFNLNALAPADSEAVAAAANAAVAALEAKYQERTIAQAAK